MPPPYRFSPPVSPEPPITPWPFATPPRRVILVGGAFDPPHTAHTSLPAAARDLHFPDAAILFVPAAISPFKAGLTATPGAARLDMLRLAIDGLPNAAAWSDEIDRAAPDAPSFTVDTLRRAAVIAPGTEFLLLIGADQAAAFHRWREARAILTLARPVVVLRDPFPTADSLVGAMRSAGFWSDAELDLWRSWTVSTPVVDVSSTRIREIVRDRGVDAVPGGWLAPAVRQHIRAHRLYQ